MSLLSQIKTDSLQARKEKLPISSALVTLLSECQNVGKSKGNRETTDDEVIAVVKKFITNINDTISKTGDKLSTDQLSGLQQELSAYEKYLPAMTDFAVIESRVKELLSNGANKGVIFKTLKTEFGNTYNPADVNKLLV